MYDNKEILKLKLATKLLVQKGTNNSWNSYSTAMFLLNRKWQAAEIKSAVAASRISELSVEKPHIPGRSPVPCGGNSMHIAATSIQAETAFCHGSLFGPKIFANFTL